MFLRATKRFKDGKVHDYWSMVENVRVGRRHDDVDHLHRAELADDLSRREDERDHDLQTVTPLVAAVAVALEIALEGLRTVNLEVRTREVEEDDVARRAK